MQFEIPGEDGTVVLTHKPRAQYRADFHADIRWSVCFRRNHVCCVGIGATGREAFEDAYRTAARSPQHFGVGR